MSFWSKIGKHTRHFSDNSTWLIAGTSNATSTLDFGASAWAIGRVQINAQVEPYFAIEVINSRVPRAGGISFEGKRLPNWQRKYLLDVHAVSVSGGIGASVLDVPLKFGGNVKTSLVGGVRGAPILRHRAHGAPSASGVGGDPTGFLGLGLQGSASATGLAGILQVTDEVKVVQMGSNFFAMCQAISKGKWLDAAKRGLGMLFARNHLQFHYTGAWVAAGLNLGIGTDVVQVLGANASLSVGVFYMPAMHLFIQHPDERKAKKWRYVYTRKLQYSGGANVSVGRPPKRQHKGPVWDQAWH